MICVTMKKHPGKQQFYALQAQTAKRLPAPTSKWPSRLQTRKSRDEPPQDRPPSNRGPRQDHRGQEPALREKLICLAEDLAKASSNCLGTAQVEESHRRAFHGFDILAAPS
jgi:hypothetical protein